MKIYKVVENAKQTFVSGAFGNPKHRVVGEHKEEVLGGYFAQKENAEELARVLAGNFPAVRVMEEKDGEVYSSEYHHMLMEYDFAIEEQEVEPEDNYILSDNQLEEIIQSILENPYALRSVEDGNFEKVRYHNYNNRIYLYESEEAQEPCKVLEDASEKELGEEE